jgi:ATP-binding cassette subfamily F protein 3
MLQVHQVYKSYGAETVLEDISFAVNPGDRVGLVGLNGCGKTTLLRIIAGLERSDAGHISLERSASLGYLPQGLELPAGQTVGEGVRSGIPGYASARREVEELTAAMVSARGADLERLVETYGEALTRFEGLGGYALDHRAKEVLAGLGLADVALDTPAAQLSGGQQTRLGLARLLLAEPTLLLLDEPTNHLDIGALEWLEGFLATYRGAVVIVSHDRTFLNHTVRRILELGESTHQMAEYPGTYSDYEQAKAREWDKHWATWKDQQAEVRRMETDVRRTMEQALHSERTFRAANLRRYAKKVAKKAKARERRLQRYLDSEERVDKPEPGWRLKMEFGAMPRSGQIVVELDGLGHAFDAHWLFRGVDLTLQHGERIVLLGPNGSGKTTLLRIIAGELEPAAGSVRLGANVRLGYMPQEQQVRTPEATPLALVRQAAPLSETEARSFLHFFLFGGDDVFVPVGSLSYGEWARLLLATLVLEGANCLLLDEPINHLDIPSRERFEAALDAFPGTVLTAVHDRAFINRFATGIWSLEAGTMRRYLDRQDMRRARESVAYAARS